MIKIFNANDRDFSTAGNIIIQPIKCNEIKKKSLNGWYIDVEVPIIYKDYISKDKLCVVKTKSKLNPQAFRIGEEINYTTRKIKFKAEHVMFDSKDYTLIDIRPTNQNGLNALNYINQRTDDVSPFTMYSNVENINTAYFIRKNLLEAWNIIEERWGGVFDADNWNISFLTSVGNDNGETIAYGKNMQGFDIFEDWSSVCTKLCPVGYDGLMLPEQFLTSDVKYEKPYTRIIDFQTDLESENQTEENLLAELRTKAEAYLEENKVPKVSYTIVSNINGNLEIGDTIKVLHPFVNIFTEVLEYEYNLISQKVVSLTFGNYSRDVKTKFENIKNTIEQVNQAISKQEVVINNQTNLINSLNKNGILYIDDNELLLLDSLPKEKAKNVWRFGLAGIGFSSNGYEGPFKIAITMDGQINADFITTGTMSVSRIEGLANFISETEKQIAEIEIEQGNITSRVSSVETGVNNITNTQGEAEGKNIHIEDSADEPFVDITLYGETNQKTRSGKNVLKSTINSQTKNGLDITVNADRSILINGTATVDTSIDLSSDFKPEAGTYTLSGCPQGGGNSTYRLYLNAVSGQDFGDGEGKVVSLSGERSTRGIISISAGVNCSNLLFKPQLEKGNTVTDYEENGVMPSPEYPSEIENLEGNIEFKVKGKNIFDFENILYNNNCKISGTADNFTVSKNVVGTYEYIIWDIGIITQNNYYLNFNSNRDGNSNIGAVYVSLDGTYANRKSILTLKNNLENYKLNVSDYQNYHLFIMFRADIPEEYENQSITNLMVCKEIITSDYEPCKSQVEYFPLEEGEKLHKGILLNGNGKNHTRNQYVITGQENWYEYTASGEYSDNLHCYFGLNDVVLDSKMAMKSSICTHFRNPGTWVIVPSVAQYGTYQDNPNTRHRYFITDIPTLAEWKAYLAEEYAKGTPVILEYDLAEPETVPYTEVQQEAWDKIEALMTYKNITNITSDAYAKVTYMRDNGLDIYETKQNASKKYTETAEKLVEQKMTVDGVITQVSNINSRTDELTGNVETINSTINTIEQTINGWSQELKNTGGNNIFYYSLDFWDNNNGLEEYSDTEIMQNSISQTGYVLNNGSAKQTQSVKNGFYTCSFNYKKLLELAVCQVKINGTTHDLTKTDWEEFEQAFEVKTNVLEIEFVSDTDNSLYISDLMVNVGKTKLSWSQNANETRTDTVTIGKGIQVNSSAKNTYHRIDADGNRTFNKTTGRVVNEATDKGTETEELVVRGQAKITGLLLQKVSDQVWINNLL